MNEDVAREVGFSPTGARIDNLDADERGEYLQIAQADLVGEEFLHARLATQGVPGDCHMFTFVDVIMMNTG